MNIQDKLALRSQDTIILFNIKLGGKHHLLTQAMRKVAFLYKEATQSNIYAFLQIMDIKRKIETATAQVTTQKNYIARKIQKKLGDSTATFPIQRVEDVEIGTPLHFDIVRLVKTFDETVCLLRLAKISGLFTQSNIFYQRKTELKKAFFTLMTALACIKTQEFPKITFEDYFSKNIVYQESIRQSPEIDPTLLFLAIQSPATPDLQPNQRNQWLAKLQENLI